MRYRLSDKATVDLRDIIAFVECQDGPRRAVALHGQFLKAFRSITTAPGLGSKREACTGDHARWWHVHNFYVIYEQEDDLIMILRIYHGARNLDALFEP